MKKITLFLLFLFSSFLIVRGQQFHAPDVKGVLYVDSAANYNFLGSSWKSAIPSLAEALKVAKKLNEKVPGRVKQIWVAKGTYTPSYSTDDGHRDEDGGRKNAFVLLKDVKIYGGFAGIE